MADSIQTTSATSSSPVSPEAPIVELIERDINSLSQLELEQFAARLSALTNHVVATAALRGSKSKKAMADDDDDVTDVGGTAKATKLAKMEAQLDELFNS